MERFDPGRAFARNLGWVTADEQALLRSRRVAIAGLGGVGGSHLVTLARLGISRFHIADIDVFEIENFNRQYGARMSTVGRAKTDVLADAARDVNPSVELRVFPDGVRADNVGDFLADVDLYVDGLDFFAVAERRAVFAACASQGIPAITAAPLGMGVALLNFLPGRMTFDEYFGMEGASEPEQLLRFFVGLAPAGLQQRYLVDPTSIDLANHRGPSTAMACELCAGAAASQALKILLGRGHVRPAPHGLQFDAYLDRTRRTWRPSGNRHPLQRLTLAIARRRLMTPRTPAPATPTGDVVRDVLDLARWAPSGDNAQPWRFERLGDRSFAVHARPGDDIYDLQGHASQLALGALLETIAIAATTRGLLARVRRRAEDERTPVFDVELVEDGGVAESPLAPAIRLRRVQRRPMPSTPLTARQVSALREAAAPFELRLLASAGDRRRAARLNFANALLRLGTPETFDTHAAAIEWNADRSEERMPDGALGVNPLTARVMRWALASRRRAAMLDRIGGSAGPAVEMDLLPGLACAAHFVLVAAQPPDSLDDYLDAGRAVQRFWLTATRVGLQVQPQYTPLVFAEYVRDRVRFTGDGRSWRRAQAIAVRLAGLLGADTVERAVFYGRIGGGPPAAARSTRLPVERLLMSASSSTAAANADGAS
ncbi:MAG TPA: ThiF family adenylyltransferase [Candidatus Dormibacteraeota bacterium]|jgi:molybdopterin/thiamine biosynthesis adenylyltransferase/nitroreductase